MITVSMPYYRTPGEVGRAVKSVLDQTWRDLRLVVVNDGGGPAVWGPLRTIEDPRLIRFNLPENRGRYFADAVTLAACDTEWWTPHDSDDWSSLERFERMLQKSGGVEAVFCGYQIHRTKSKVAGSVKPRPDRVVKSDVLRHVAHHTALYRTEALKRIGGPHPGWRIAWDTFMVGVVVNTLKWACVEEPYYHYAQRKDSLSLCNETGMGSPIRKTIHREREEAWADFISSGNILRETRPEVLAEVESHAQRLREILLERAAA